MRLTVLTFWLNFLTVFLTFLTVFAQQALARLRDTEVVEVVSLVIEELVEGELLQIRVGSGKTLGKEGQSTSNPLRLSGSIKSSVFFHKQNLCFYGPTKTHASLGLIILTDCL